MPIPNTLFLNQLYSIDKDGSKNLVEQTEQGRPFTFISGFGFSLDSFEQRIVNMQKGEKFDFTLAPAEAFGEYFAEGVHKLPREEFVIDGKFDSANIFPGAVITMKNEEGQHFMVRVTKVEEDGVTLDANHPLAGETLQFTGAILENREIQKLIAQMSHECGGCGSCGGDCGGDCGDDHECGGGGCGHCHH